MINSPKWTSSSRQTSYITQHQQQSPAVQQAAQAAAAAAQQSRIEEELFLQLPLWAQRFTRQVPELPSGRRTLLQLLSSFEDVKTKAADACGEQKAAVEAYLQLALVDIVSQAWQQHMEELEQSLDVTAAQVGSSSSNTPRAAGTHCRRRSSSARIMCSVFDGMRDIIPTSAALLVAASGSMDHFLVQQM
jgi:uncharacterized protein (DUF2267 family)